MDPLLTITDVARLLGRSPQTVKRDLNRNPMAVPPRVALPGTRLLRWRATDVELWIARHAETQAAGCFKACPCQGNSGLSGNRMAVPLQEAI